jgi:hypothetical protein
MAYRRIFRKDEHELDFAKYGYFTMQLISSEEIIFLTQIFETVRPRDAKNFYATIDIDDQNYRREVHQHINGKIGKKLADIFINYSPLVFNFIVKLPGDDTEVFIHNDHTHVDETLFQSVNIWIPLVDTNNENGMLYVLPGSQNFPNPPRGFEMPYPYSQFHQAIKPHTIPIPLKAGEAIVYNNKMLHRSDPNLSKLARPAIITGMLPDEAQPMIYFKHKDLSENKVEMFVLDREFYFTFDRYICPDFAKSIGIRDYKELKFTEQDVLKMISNLKIEQEKTG